jgi:homoserine dehydrogenase
VPEQIVKHISVVQVGLGLIGGTVAEQIVANRSAWREQGLDVGISAILTTGGALVAGAEGFTDSLLAEIVNLRRSGMDLPQIGAALEIKSVPSIDFDLARLGMKRPVVLDAAAGSATSALAVAALESGGAVIYSNKAPLAQPLAEATRLWEGARAGLVRYETTCGAGLPVISTIKSLQRTGDRIIEIVGCLSGTLGAIFSDIAAGKQFSAAIHAAKEAGYTEPDPRDDLSGLDVARKALILARTMGRTVDLDQIGVESLVPASLANCPVPTFLERIAEQDAAIAMRNAEADNEGSALKYVATVPADGPITVGLEPVAKSTVLGALQGPENIISIRTERYDRYPLTISGPGAGAAVTAAGMIADMLDLARMG